MRASGKSRYFAQPLGLSLCVCLSACLSVWLSVCLSPFPSILPVFKSIFFTFRKQTCKGWQEKGTKSILLRMKISAWNYIYILSSAAVLYMWEVMNVQTLILLYKYNLYRLWLFEISRFYYFLSVLPRYRRKRKKRLKPKKGNGHLLACRCLLPICWYCWTNSWVLN